jgi:hypothetical protein
MLSPAPQATTFSSFSGQGLATRTLPPEVEALVFTDFSRW